MGDLVYIVKKSGHEGGYGVMQTLVRAANKTLARSEGAANLGVDPNTVIVEEYRTLGRSTADLRAQVQELIEADKEVSDEDNPYVE